MFNFELYKEGLRKTKTLGILFIIGMLLGSITQPLLGIISWMNGIRGGWITTGSLMHVRGIEASYMMLFAPFAGAPVITLSMFSFLNKRSSSDFYHALPHKRETLFGSFIAAILTWVVGGMWLSTMVSVIIYAISPYTIVNMGSIILAVLGMSAASFLVVAATALAITITGNTLSNIVASGLILFLPRILISMFVSMVVEMTLVVNSADFGLLGNHHYNIVIGIFIAIFAGVPTGNMFTIGTFYTLILGILYMVAAGIIFKKRRSEIAGNSGSKFIQPTIRIMVTFAITLIAILMIFNLSDDHDYRISRVFQIEGIIVVYIIAAFSYFVYEFLTTKRIPKLIKMIPGLLIVAALNIIFIVGINISRNVILQEVNVSDIRSVTIVELHDRWGALTFVELNMRRVDITDNEITEILGETLNNNIRRVVERGRQSTAGHRVRVIFNIEGGRNITRSVWVRSLSELNNLLSEYEPYQEIFMRMPENPDQLFIWGNEESLTQEQLHHIYNVLYEEVAELSFSEWHEANERMMGSRWHFIEVNCSNYRSTFPIIEELTPQTYELLTSYLENED